MTYTPKLISQSILICLLSAIFYCYEYFLRVIPSVLTNELMELHQLSHEGLGLLSAAFYLTYMLAQIPVGLLMDKYGPRLVLTIACLLCSLGTILFCQMQSLLVVVIGRALVGLGSAFAFVGFLKIVASWLPKKFYGFMVGVCMLLGMVGAVLGQRIIAHGIIETPWEVIVLYSAYVGLALALILWLCLRNNPQEHNQQQHLTNTSTKILANLITSLSDHKIWILGVIGFFTFLSLAGFAEMWAVPYFEALDFSKDEAAKISAMIFWGFGVGGPLWGIISDYYNSRYIPLAIGSLLTTLVFAMILGMPSLSSTSFKLLAFLLGALSSVEILIFSAANDLSTNEDNATKTSIVNMVVMIGGIMIQPLAGKIIDLFNDHSILSYQAALSPILGSFAGATILSIYMHLSTRKA